MDKIIPRWEWRTFGSKFGVSEEKIQNHKLGNFKRSSEKYIYFPRTATTTARSATT